MDFIYPFGIGVVMGIMLSGQKINTQNIAVAFFVAVLWPIFLFFWLISTSSEKDE